MWTVLKSGKISFKYVVLIFVLLLVSAMAYMIIPSFLGSMIDDGVANQKYSAIFGNAIAMFVVSFINIATFVVAIKIIGKVVTEFGQTLRILIFDRVLSFSSKEIDKYGTTTLITRSTADISNVQNFIMYFLANGLLAPLMFVSGIILVGNKAGRLTVVLLIAIPIVLFVMAVILVLTINKQDKLRKHLDNINMAFLENLQGVRVIRAFNKQKFEKNRFNKLNETASDCLFDSTHISGMFNPATQFIFGMTTVSIMVFGSWMVINNGLNVGDLVAVNQYVQFLLASIIMFSLIVNMYPKFIVCARRIEEVLNTKTSIKDGKLTTADKKLVSTVEFKDVTFSYSNSNTAVLNNINFKAEPGQTVAIIGKTGSGKSSFLRLILRLYDTTFGKVLVDGIDVRDYKLDDLRSLIGYVPQKSVLFNGDIAYNLNFGNENATEQDWEWACKVACADEFIKDKDNTYHAEITQGGKNLSGGQRQRMAIARALVKRPEILIFDDSFSALDLKTDRTLRTNLKNELKDTLVIMVAQRISTIKDADLILVIDDNKIVGSGKHDQLMQNCALYKEIAELQNGGDL